MSNAFLDSRLAAREGLQDTLRRTEAKRERAMFLRALRKAAGLTQQELADRAGWKQPFVARLERLTGAVPDDATVARYAAGCGFQLERVYRAEPVPGGRADTAGAHRVEVAF